MSTSTTTMDVSAVVPVASGVFPAASVTDPDVAERGSDAGASPADITPARQAEFAERGARLREMHWTDIPRLAELEREAFADDAWTEASWWAELAARPRREYVVVTSLDVPDGADALAQDDDAEDGSADTVETRQGGRQVMPRSDVGVGDETTRSDDDPRGDGPTGEILGYAGLDHSGDVADVMTIAIAPAGRRRGLGTVLLAHLIDRTRARGEGHLILEVRADNAAALALYERAGFTTLSVRRRYYPGDVDAHVMRLTLEGVS